MDNKDKKGKQDALEVAEVKARLIIQYLCK